MSATSAGNVAIVVSGGPAPGINSVISAATIAAVKLGASVFGLRDGFDRVAKDGGTALTPLSIEQVSRIYARGGSILGTSRSNPLKNPQSSELFRNALSTHRINKLINIGGDGSAYLSLLISKAFPELAVVHIPKTIDNDLPLPPGVPSFGFETAREVGTTLVTTLLTDAKTTGRWYLVTTMGRTAGHLALGLGIAGGATLTLIPEEFAPNTSLDQIGSRIAKTIELRAAQGKRHGVVLLAEGILDRVDPKSCAELATAQRDELGRLIHSSLDIGALLARCVAPKLELAAKITLTTKTIGYELRCCDPCSFDIEYTRLLGVAAVDELWRGTRGTMLVRHGEAFTAIPLTELCTPDGKKIRTREVDLQSDLFRLASKLMVK